MPNKCHIEQLGEEEGRALFVIFNEDTEVIAYIYRELNKEKGMYYDYNSILKNKKKDMDVEIINPEPLFNLLRQTIELTTTIDGKQIYEKIMIKANSCIVLHTNYPLSDEAKQVNKTFNNQPTFKGNLIRLKQNAGGVLLTIYLSLLAFCASLSQKGKWRWIGRAASLLLFILLFVCLYTNIEILLFCLFLCSIIWIVFFYQNDKLIWFIESIFGGT